ncbi:hypothetical protein DM02DRAFT_673856 [Periconia macrospinosa]|uniref:Ubiquitin-like-conjugating enzyme ATG10 n=1 Tax=Periconia macrospinosa TaxID=97972 RepID=A0A2V1DKX4_9PLEO|nr:hypothetical protein DM02DRAFT_673856 [Periconia macrospinosa]
MELVKNFPYLTISEFSSAISSLQSLFYRIPPSPKESGENPWLSVDIIQEHGTHYLRITKSLCTHTHTRERTSLTQGKHDQVTKQPQSSSSSDREVQVVEEYDADDQIILDNKNPQPLICYDIMLSPTYSVPVLYFSVKDVAHRYPPTMRVLYDHVIPQGYAEQTKEGSGVLGGVTVADHPITNAPVYFIHPCKTASVLQASTSFISPHNESARLDHLSYLILWIGAMGKYVGLDVPIDLGTAVKREKEEGNGTT